MTQDIGWMDATAQAALVARGEIHPKELLDIALARANATVELGNIIPLRFDDLPGWTAARQPVPRHRERTGERVRYSCVDFSAASLRHRALTERPRQHAPCLGP